MSRYRPLSNITELIIHCAATPNGRWFTARDIDGWHAQRGFKRDPKIIGFQRPDLAHIGYHFVIGLKGGVEVGRKLEETGAHAYNHNRQSIGTCLIGTDQFTADQWLSLKQHVQALKNRFPNLRIVGHRDLSPDRNGDGKIDPQEWLKTCPGFDVAEWLANDMQPLANHIFPPNT